MEIQGKVWGNTSTVFKKNNVEVHHINIKKGGFCSKHLHSAKFNYFRVLKGLLKIKVWKDYGSAELVDETTLSAGQEMTVAPGEYHQFEALEKTEALEIYWVQLESDDIQRVDHGGKK
jgi:mannose-6-phosphate isomerase-like protein (cupin superfamily)